MPYTKIWGVSLSLKSGFCFHLGLAVVMACLLPSFEANAQTTPIPRPSLEESIQAAYGMGRETTQRIHCSSPQDATTTNRLMPNIRSNTALSLGNTPQDAAQIEAAFDQGVLAATQTPEDCAAWAARMNPATASQQNTAYSPELLAISPDLAYHAGELAMLYERCGGADEQGLIGGSASAFRDQITSSFDGPQQDTIQIQSAFDQGMTAAHQNTGCLGWQGQAAGLMFKIYQKGAPFIPAQ